MDIVQTGGNKMKVFYIFFTVLIGIPSLVNAADKTWETLSDETVLRKILVEKSNLKDPFSIQFRQVKVSNSKAVDNAPITIWCGEVNAKNSYGAYSGWKLFFAISNGKEASVSIDEEIGHEGFLVLMGAFCKGSGLIK